MKKGLSTLLAIFVVFSMILSVVGCQGNKSSGESNVQSTSEDTSSTTTAQTTSNQESEPVDQFGKYTPAIELTAIRGIPAGSTEANYTHNVWIQEYEKQLGIKLKYKWMVIGDQYEQKVNLMLASNDLADVMQVNLRQLYQMAEAGQIQDLKAVWDAYATDQVKAAMTAGGTSSFDIATIDGKLYGIPAVVPILESMHVLYVREDWRKELGLPEPKTIDDMEKIMYAFRDQDPNKNGEKDTLGIGLNKNLFTNGYEITSFCNMFGAYPRAWVEDANGNLQYGGIMPEMKEALLRLNKYYKEGLIDKEFTVKDEDKASQSVAKEQLGMFFGVQWASFIGDAVPSAFKNNENCEWTIYQLPDGPKGPTKPIVYNNTNSFLVVSSECKYPEAPVKINNYIHLMGLGPQGEGRFAKTYEEWKELWDVCGDGLWLPETVHGNIQRWINTFKAIETGDTTEVNKNYLNIQQYTDVSNFLKDGRKMKNINGEEDLGLAAAAHGWVMSGKNFLKALELNDAGMLQYDRLGKYVSPTMIENQATLDKMELEIITRIIVGDASIDEFDNYVEQWKSLGGEQITKELNEWYSKNK